MGLTHPLFLRVSPKFASRELLVALRYFVNTAPYLDWQLHYADFFRKDTDPQRKSPWVWKCVFRYVFGHLWPLALCL